VVLVFSLANHGASIAVLFLRAGVALSGFESLPTAGYLGRSGPLRLGQPLPPQPVEVDALPVDGVHSVCPGSPMHVPS
jgi:hypothetical protein